MKLTGSCYCRAIRYEINLRSPNDEERRYATVKTANAILTRALQKAFGTNYGLTTKIPRDAFTYTQDKPKEHAADNRFGTVICRELCDTCGSFILEYREPAKPHWRYVCVGSVDDVDVLPPKGEFFSKYRANWMPRVRGHLPWTFCRGVKVDAAVRI